MALMWLNPSSMKHIADTLNAQIREKGPPNFSRSLVPEMSVWEIKCFAGEGPAVA